MPRFYHNDPLYNAALREMGSRLRRLMDERSWSRADLTRAAQKFMPEGGRFGPDNTSNFVNGKRRPTRPFIVAMSKALGVEESDFMPPYLVEGAPGEAPAGPLLTQILGQKDLFRVVIDRQLPLKKAMKIIQALEETESEDAS